MKTRQCYSVSGRYCFLPKALGLSRERRSPPLSLGRLGRPFLPLSLQQGRGREGLRGSRPGSHRPKAGVKGGMAAQGHRAGLGGNQEGRDSGLFDLKPFGHLTFLLSRLLKCLLCARHGAGGGHGAGTRQGSAGLRDGAEGTNAGHMMR